MRPIGPRLLPLLGILLLATAASADDSPLVKLLKSGRVPEARLAAILDQIGKRGTAADLGYLFERSVDPKGFPPSARLKALDALAEAALTRKVRPEGDLARLAGILNEKDAPVRLAAARLAGLWKVEALGKPLADLAGAADTPAELRAAALDALAALGASHKSEIVALTKPGKAPEVRARAAAALAGLDVAEAATAAASALHDAAPGQDFAPMLAPFLSAKGGPAALAGALGTTDLPPDAAKLGLRALYALGSSEPGLVDVLSKAAKISGDVRPPSKEEVDRLIAEVASQGDPARGERVFRRAELNCMKCHAVAGAAGGVGPELSAVGGSSPVDYLINSIMVPDQAIKEEFHTKVVQTADGRVFLGIVVDKDDKRLVLREATGDLRTIPADEVEDSKDGGSLMPKGLVNFLTRGEFVDLLRFLSELGKPGPYAIHTTPTIQRWRLLRPAPSDPAEALKADASLWQPAYALVPGTLPLDELAAQAGGAALYLRGEVNVTAAGPVEFRLGSAEGVSAWVDGKPAEGTTFAAELEPGVHALTLRVDTSARKAPLKVEVVKPEGSSAEFTVVGGR
jgi:putative heme-binding domain-containing protein